MTPDDWALFLARLFLGGPLLYIALVMLLDPAGLVAGLQRAQEAVEQLTERLSGSHWMPPARQPLPDSASVRSFVRGIGLALALFAMACLVGAAGF